MMWQRWRMTFKHIHDDSSVSLQQQVHHRILDIADLLLWKGYSVQLCCWCDVSATSTINIHKREQQNNISMFRTLSVMSYFPVDRMSIYTRQQPFSVFPWYYFSCHPHAMSDPCNLKRLSCQHKFRDQGKCGLCSPAHAPSDGHPEHYSVDRRGRQVMGQTNQWHIEWGECHNRSKTIEWITLYVPSYAKKKKKKKWNSSNLN